MPFTFFMIIYVFPFVLPRDPFCSTDRHCWCRHIFCHYLNTLLEGSSVQIEIICVLQFPCCWLVHHIKEKGELTDKTIVFCNTMNDVACVVNYLMMKLEKHAYSPKEFCEQPNCLIGIYHSSSWPHCKNRIVQSLRGEGKVCVLVAFPVLSMGVNFWYIVNWGPARSLLHQHQEAGWAGRDGLPSHVLIIYNGQKLSVTWISPLWGTI